MTTHRYHLEMQAFDGEWFTPAGLEEEQRGFLLGYMFGRADGPPPRLAMRVVRSDGKVVDERPADTEVSIGMVAGWPTPEQYEAAAERALATAAKIREARDDEGRDWPKNYSPRQTGDQFVWHHNDGVNPSLGSMRAWETVEEARLAAWEHTMGHDS